ncbi:hypothetical protein HPP92_003430 [Vanilla planifolia]|uniref:Growth-regulating factor n=1 Tax=Vanilla planifolia TaxID=51239 RepID=A0A835RV51_VANPL|nr:hypothetical protein HPP92_003430 [Vanilla planifolia]
MKALVEAEERRDEQYGRRCRIGTEVPTAVHGVAMGRAGAPSTIFKYLVAGYLFLLISFSQSKEVMNRWQPALPHPSFGYRSYYGKKMDPEPGRCRRTDGKKWRCSKDAYPDLALRAAYASYRNRSRKHGIAASLPTSQPLVVNSNSTSTIRCRKLNKWDKRRCCCGRWGFHDLQFIRFPHTPFLAQLLGWDPYLILKILGPHPSLNLFALYLDHEITMTLGGNVNMECPLTSRYHELADCYLVSGLVPSEDDMRNLWFRVC